MKKRAFSVIELLVVVAVIGLLAVIAVIAFNNARAKARDSRRLADINSVLQALSTAAEDDIVAFGCTSAGALDACGSASLDPYIRLSKVSDPSEPSSNCASGSSAPCEYYLTTGPSLPSSMTTVNYTIWFYLEKGTAGLAAGPHSATQNGVR